MINEFRKPALLFLIMFLFGFAGLENPETSGSRMLLARRTIAGIIEQNSRNLDKLQSGMSRARVLEIMENKPLTAYQDGEKITVTNPLREETLIGKEKSVDILYYMTAGGSGDYTITDDKLTPVVFEDNKLIGLGWGFLEETAKNYEIELRK